MIRRRDLVVVIVLLALAAAASFLLFSGAPDEPMMPPAQSTPAAVPVKGVRADGAARRARHAEERPAPEKAPKGPPASLLVRVTGFVPGRDGPAPLDGAA